MIVIEAARFKSRMVDNALFVLSTLFHLLTTSTNFHTTPAFVWLGDPFQRTVGTLAPG